MSCFTIIEDMKMGFLSATGQNASNLYVGENEMKIMMIEAKNFGVTRQEDKEEAIHRACGLKLFKVNIDTHLALGIDCEDI